MNARRRWRHWLAWFLLGDERCAGCGTLTLRLRKPVKLELDESYQSCGATQGGTWSGTGAIATCWERRGHDGPHTDDVTVRWYDPVPILFGSLYVHSADGQETA